MCSAGWPLVDGSRWPCRPARWLGPVAQRQRLIAEQLHRAREAVQRQTKTWGLTGETAEVGAGPGLTSDAWPAKTPVRGRPDAIRLVVRHRRRVVRGEVNTARRGVQLQGG